MLDAQSVPHLPGVPVLDVDGDIIGSVDRVYIHQDTGAPLWLSIDTHFNGAPNAVAPLEDARFDDQPGSALHLGLTRAVIEDAPLITSFDTLTTDDVHTLRSYYYGMSPTAPAPAQHRAKDMTAQDLPAPEGADVIRFEEQLKVSTIPVPTERVRFQKVIVTEERTVTVTVRREELRVIRDPLTELPDQNLSLAPAPLQDLEMVLHEERVVTTTEVVPVERVRVRVRRVAENLPVTDSVRKERVDISTSAP